MRATCRVVNPAGFGSNVSDGPWLWCWRTLARGRSLPRWVRMLSDRWAMRGPFLLHLVSDDRPDLGMGQPLRAQLVEPLPAPEPAEPPLPEICQQVFHKLDLCGV